MTLKMIELDFNQDGHDAILQRMTGIKNFHLFASLVATTTHQTSNTEYINSYNPCGNKLPDTSDVVVVGGGIHALIYAIHARSLELKEDESTCDTALEHRYSCNITSKRCLKDEFFSKSVRQIGNGF